MLTLKPRRFFGTILFFAVSVVLFFYRPQLAERDRLVRRDPQLQSSDRFASLATVWAAYEFEPEAFLLEVLGRYSKHNKLLQRILVHNRLAGGSNVERSSS